MAITYVGAGAAVYSNANPSPAAPTHAVGDLLIAIVGTKPDTTPATTPSGWTQLGAVAGGTGTTGTDTGPMRVGIFYKIATGTTDSTGSITVTGNSVSAAQVFAYRCAAGNVLDIAGTGAADTTTGTAFTATMPINPGLTVADELLCVGVIPTDIGAGAQFTAETVSATGMTTVTLTEINEWTTSVGNDMGGWVARGPVVTGTATAAPTISSTASGTTTAVAGPLYLIRLRELPAQATKSASDSGTFSATEVSSLVAITDKSASDSGTFSATETSNLVKLSPPPTLSNFAATSSVTGLASSRTISAYTYSTNAYTVVLCVNALGSPTLTLSNGLTPTLLGTSTTAGVTHTYWGIQGGASSTTDFTVTTQTSQHFAFSVISYNGVNSVTTPVVVAADSTSIDTTSSQILFWGWGNDTGGTEPAAFTAPIGNASSLALYETGSAFVTSSYRVSSLSSGTNTFGYVGSSSGGSSSYVLLDSVASNNLSGSVSLSGSGTLTVSGVASASGAVNLTGSGTLTSTASVTASGSVNLSGSGTLTTSGSKSASAPVSLSGSGTLTTTGTAAFSASVPLTGSGTLTTSGSASFAGNATLSGSGTLTASGSASISGLGPVGTSGCRTWVRAKDLPTGAFTTWTDQSGAGLNGTSAGAPQVYASQTPSGGKAVGFVNNAANYIQFPGLLSSATAFDIWVVVKSADTRTSLWALGGNSGAVDEAHYPYDGVVYENAGLASGQRKSFTPTLAITQWRTYRVTHDGTTYKIFLDGVEQFSSTSGVTIGFNSTMALGAGMKSGTTDFSFGDGRVAEFFAYDNVKNTTDSNAIYSYLQTEHFSVNATDTASLTGSGTLTATGSKAASGSVSLTGSGTLTATGAKAVSGNATLTGSGTLALSGSKAVSSIAALTGSGSLTPLATSTVLAGAVNLTGSGTLTASGTAAQAASGSVNLTGSGTLTTSGTPAPTGSANPSGSGTLTTTGAPAHTGSVALTGSGTLTIASTAITASKTAALTGVGSLTPAASVTAVSGAVSLSGSGTLTIVGQQAQVVALTGSGTLTAASTSVQNSGSVNLTGSGTLTAAGSVSGVSGAVNLTGSGTLTTTGSKAVTGGAPLTGSGTLAPVGSKAVSGAAALTGSGSLTATGTSSQTGSVALSGSGTLTAASSAISMAGTANFTSAGTLVPVGSAQQQGSTSVGLSGLGSLTNTGAAMSTSGSVALTGSGTLTATGSKSSSGSAATSGSGTLTVSGVKAVSATASLTGSGTLTLSGKANTASTVSFTGTGGLTLSGILAVTRPLSLTGAGTLTASGVAGYSGSVALSGSGTLTAVAGTSIKIRVGNAWVDKQLYVETAGGIPVSPRGLFRWNGTDWV